MTKAAASLRNSFGYLPRRRPGVDGTSVTTGMTTSYMRCPANGGMLIVSDVSDTLAFQSLPSCFSKVVALMTTPSRRTQRGESPRSHLQVPGWKTRFQQGIPQRGTPPDRG